MPFRVATVLDAALQRRRIAARAAAWAALAASCLAFASHPSAPLAARDNNTSSKELAQRVKEMQAELERQRRAQEQKLKEMQRAAQEAQRQAEREARKRQEEMEREMRLARERAMREAERERERQMKEAQRAAEQARKEAQRQQEQAVREAQKAAQKAAEQEQKRQAEEARRRQAEDERRRAAEQQRERERLAREQKNTAARDDVASDRAAPKDLDKTRAWIAEDEARQRDAAKRRKDGQKDNGQANAPTGPVSLPPTVARPRVLPPDRTAPAPGAAGKQAGSGGAPRADARNGRPAAKLLPVPADFPGKEKGAEMPPELFAKARQEEFVVPLLSPADAAKAAERGFALSQPVVVGGATVQRLRAPGYVGNEAERELHRELPFVPVMPNYAYSIYIGSLGEGAGPEGPGKVAAASASPCPESVCFGGHVISWSQAAGQCTRAARIGIIDTSFDTTHPAFAALKATQRTFLDGEKPSPFDWHGTAVLSLLAGHPMSSTPGLAPEATYFLATAFRSDAAGNASADTVRLLAALAWLEESDVDIVNMSFAGPQDPSVAKAIARMSKKGIVFVAAAGNTGPNMPPSYPAAYPQVIAVTAVNRDGNNYRHANRGPHIDVSAPGVDILTALPRAQQATRTGTSFAAPFVTAILATQGDLAFTGAKSKLLESISMRDLGPPGRDPIYGSGLALAPKSCAGGAGVASGSPAPATTEAAIKSWSSNTTLMRAGAMP